jgi:hypothetical protein
MAFQNQDELVKSIRPRKGDKIISLEEAMKDVALALCGSNVGSFGFNDGDIVVIPDAKTIKLRAREKSFHKQTATILSITAQVNNKWEFVPVWVFRKKTRKEADMPHELSTNQFFSEMMRADDDIRRVQLIAGKTFKVKTLEVELINSETNEPYSATFYLFEEIKQEEAAA